MVTAALRLQPLLARAQKLRIKDQALSITSAKNMNGEGFFGVTIFTKCRWSLAITQP